MILNPSSSITSIRLLLLLLIHSNHAIIIYLFQFHLMAIFHSIRNRLNISLSTINVMTFFGNIKAIRSLHQVHLIRELTFSFRLKHFIMEVYRIVIIIRRSLTILFILSTIIRVLELLN